MDAILQVENLKTSFFTSNGEVQAVRGVSFSVNKGDILGIVGESGSGKSVTSMSILKLLADTGRVKEGTILFEGQDLTKFNKTQMRKIRGGKISMIFQDPMSSLNPLIPVGKQVAEMLKEHHKEMGTEKRGFRTVFQSPDTGAGETVQFLPSRVFRRYAAKSDDCHGAGQ